MTTAQVRTRALAGVDAPPVTVEVHLAPGLPGFHLVGLPETAVREARVRVRSALQNSQFDFPMSRIAINLAPADLPKEGTRFDLAIAIGILAASGQVPPAAIEDREFLAELALTGALRPVPGALAAATACAAAGRWLHVHDDNTEEVALAPGVRAITSATLADTVAGLSGTAPELRVAETSFACLPVEGARPDLAEVVGQLQARRALEIAAAGGHHLLLSGPPGTGKTMLAQRLPDLFPPLAADEYRDIARIHTLKSAASGLPPPTRPFRSPHHGLSAPALVGGGSRPGPGEVSLAHRGVLFLDELPEFPRHVLDMLREPLESGRVTVVRARGSTTFPAEFQLVAAMNPCPCGAHGDATLECRCSPTQIDQYQGRVSQALLDRLDLHVKLGRQPLDSVFAQHGALETSATVQARVLAARARQQARQQVSNARLPSGALRDALALGDGAEAAVLAAAETLRLTRRGLDRVLKVARTIADLAASEGTERDHVLEALALRTPAR